MHAFVLVQFCYDSTILQETQRHIRQRLLNELITHDK